MIPVRDVIPSRSTPWVTLALIAASASIVVYQMVLQAESDRALVVFFYQYGLVPVQFSWTSAITAMFLHTGWLHLAGNLVALWILGDNVEGRLGHGRFVLLYLAAGLAGNLLEAALSPNLPVPFVGAAGAIAGVAGAYLVLFPGSKILILLPLIVRFDIVEVPVALFLLAWLLVQIITGTTLSNGLAAGGGSFISLAGGFALGAAAGWIVGRHRLPIW